MHTKSDNTRATLAFVAPFLVFVGLMGIEKSLSLPGVWMYPLRFVASLAAILIYSRGYFSLRPISPVPSIVIGVAVLAIWVAPDELFHYRHHWLFENSITGKAATSLPPELQQNPLFLVLRSISSFALVPILEELFWRGWMMRWLIDNDFQKVPLGKYAPLSFWLVAVLFASEHGPYWEVGLVAGIVYNWWMVRTRSIADCILAHAVTNALLCVWVLRTGQWQYWL